MNLRAYVPVTITYNEKGINIMKKAFFLIFYLIIVTLKFKSNVIHISMIIRNVNVL